MQKNLLESCKTVLNDEFLFESFFDTLYQFYPAISAILGYSLGAVGAAWVDSLYNKKDPTLKSALLILKKFKKDKEFISLAKRASSVEGKSDSSSKQIRDDLRSYLKNNTSEDEYSHLKGILFKLAKENS